VPAAGFTHASNVNAFVRCSEALSGIVTFALVPLKTSADPNFPFAVQVVFATVPLLPFPDESETDDPDPSPNPNAATNPVEADVVAAAAVGE
jgi:hypothetical protein